MGSEAVQHLWLWWVSNQVVCLVFGHRCWSVLQLSFLVTGLASLILLHSAKSVMVWSGRSGCCRSSAVCSQANKREAYINFSESGISFILFKQIKYQHSQFSLLLSRTATLCNTGCEERLCRPRLNKLLLWTTKSATCVFPCPLQYNFFNNHKTDPKHTRY